MANTKFQIKRSAVSGRLPNTSDPSNTAFIDAGELAINLIDEKVFSSNGTISFEVGANLTSISVSGNATFSSIVANGSVGTDGQVLASNGSTVYWETAAGGGGGNSYSTIVISNPLGSNVDLISNSVNTAVTFIGESGISLFANVTTYEVTFALQPGLQGIVVDYGSIDEDVFAFFDYGIIS